MHPFVKNSLLKQSFSWKALSSVSTDGSKVYADAVSIKGYLVHQVTFVTNSIGDKENSKIQVFIDELDAGRVKAGDTVTVSFDGRTYVVIDVLVYHKEDNILDYGVILL